jgi:hypothetical protein
MMDFGRNLVRAHSGGVTSARIFSKELAILIYSRAAALKFGTTGPTRKTRQERSGQK